MFNTEYNERGNIARESELLSEEQSPIELDYEYDTQNRLTRLSNSYTNQTELLSYEEDRLSQRVLQTNNSSQQTRETFSYEDLGHSSMATTDTVYVQADDKKRALSGKERKV